jgi:hypothetical protein
MGENESRLGAEHQAQLDEFLRFRMECRSGLDAQVGASLLAKSSSSPPLVTALTIGPSKTNPVLPDFFAAREDFVPRASSP